VQPDLPPPAAQPRVPEARSVPFAPESISLGLYLEDLDPPEAIAELLRQAELAVSVGFDGVTVSEHHAGKLGYLPSPVLGASWILDRVDSGWSAACPILLPLRPLSLLVEEIGWLASRHVGRLGVGFAPGFASEDFDLAGVPVDRRRADFNARLRPAVAALRGEAGGLLADDPAVTRLSTLPVPVLSAVGGPLGARKAAEAGAGMLIAYMVYPSQARDLCAIYHASGGDGPLVFIRCCSLGGDSPSKLPTPDRRRSLSPPRSWAVAAKGNEVEARTAEEMAARLSASFLASGATALSIRLQRPGSSTPESSRRQIRRFGSEVLPELRRLIRRQAGLATS
jgi:alkanesulfonate monooxygenase SsuD/methylene tetrahydromethanopterin reductase-like flavin-dependent oxidoreductase (luciferase family)